MRNQARLEVRCTEISLDLVGNMAICFTVLFNYKGYQSSTKKKSGHSHAEFQFRHGFSVISMSEETFPELRTQRLGGLHQNQSTVHV